MAVLIDPPTWPAHGTFFSHLVSDSSLEELHDFAASAGIPRRAFDGDHYDVAAAHFRNLIRAGAEGVSGNELARRLLASGLRIPARERPSKVRPALRHEWGLLLPGHLDLGEDLLERWSAPDRHYHSGVHLLEMLSALDYLCEARGMSAASQRTLRLAAWFHDAVYNGVAGQDEEDSALLAEQSLSSLPGNGLDPLEIQEVARLVRLTAHHNPEHSDDAGRVITDADLSILGRSPARYARYVRDVRADYAHVPDQDFQRGRLAVVENLLSRDPLFRTTAGRARWSEPARINLTEERDRLLQAP